MCTCIAMRKGNFLFGRNMDIERSFGEMVVAVPRAFRMPYKLVRGSERRYAMMGMATVQEGVPLFAEAFNERGLCIASLRFEGNAHYFPMQRDGVYNLAPYEVIPFLLERCERCCRQSACCGRPASSPFLFLPLCRLRPYTLFSRTRRILSLRSRVRTDCICTKTARGYSPTTRLSRIRCSGSAIICTSPCASRATPFRRNCPAPVRAGHGRDGASGGRLFLLPLRACRIFAAQFQKGGGRGASVPYPVLGGGGARKRDHGVGGGGIHPLFLRHRSQRRRLFLQDV